MLCLFCRLLFVSGCGLTWMAAGVVVVVVTEDPKDRVGVGVGCREGEPGEEGSGMGSWGLIWEGRRARSDCVYLRFKFRTCVSC